MGTKLIVLLLIINIFVSCINSRKRNDDFYINKNDFSKAYKTAIVCGCLTEATNRNFAQFLKDNNDLGLFTQGQMTSDLTIKEAFELGTIKARNIKSIDYEDVKHLKPIFSECMELAFSKSIDSLVKIRYKYYIKN